MAKRTELTNQQRKFTCNIISGQGNLEAYRDAYPTSIKWKAQSASQAAVKLLKHPMVAAMVSQGHNEARERAVCTRQRALEILSEQAEGKLGDLIDDNGKIDVQAVKKAGSSVKSIQTTITVTEFGESTSHKVTINGQKEAIDSLAKLENWNKEKATGETQSVILNLNLSPSKKNH